MKKIASGSPSLNTCKSINVARNSNNNNRMCEKNSSYIYIYNYNYIDADMWSCALEIMEKKEKHTHTCRKKATNLSRFRFVSFIFMTRWPDNKIKHVCLFFLLIYLFYPFILCSPIRVCIALHRIALQCSVHVCSRLVFLLFVFFICVCLFYLIRSVSSGSSETFYAIDFRFCHKTIKRNRLHY